MRYINNVRFSVVSCRRFRFSYRWFSNQLWQNSKFNFRFLQGVAVSFCAHNEFVSSSIRYGISRHTRHFLYCYLHSTIFNVLLDRFYCILIVRQLKLWHLRQSVISNFLRSREIKPIHLVYNYFPRKRFYVLYVY